jgi:phosphate transport system substrate-binding protein
MTFTQMRNKAGKDVLPTIKSFQAAAASADWKKAQGYYVVLTDQAGEETWPITGASFILMHRSQENEEHAKAILKFFDWCYKHGAQMAEKLDYVPIPQSVYRLVEETWKKEMRAGERQIWP